MAHQPVLLHEVIEGLDIQPGDIVVDGTVGSGGHAEAILHTYGDSITLIGIDRDQESIDRSASRLAGTGKTHFFQGNFRDIVKILTGNGFPGANKILLDLGWSTDQFETSGRGFSFLKDEPLLMTFEKVDPNNKPLVTAETIVNTWGEETIADILFGFGEERYARRIAKAVVEYREMHPITTTFELGGIIEEAVPASYRNKKIHFATKTFQALRIAVNDEFGALKDGLRGAWQSLLPGGRLAVISFHSGEDRIIKRFFKELQNTDMEDGHKAVIITKKPLVAGRAEQLENRKSRSAKLRIISKI